MSNSKKMLIPFRPLFPLIIITLLFIYEEKVSNPSCKVVLHGTNFTSFDGKEPDSDDLKVMIVANLLFLGSDSGYSSLYFRDYYLSKFFKKSVESLNPDLLLVLGDISAKGYELTTTKWSSVLQQFHGTFASFDGLPFHAVLGDRDIGECTDLKPNTINWISSNLPGLDSAGCGAFDISNISFVSLNSVALLCGNNNLRFHVEKVIERESIDIQMETDGLGETANQSNGGKEAMTNFPFRENSMSAGSGPVLLLHFPLYRTADRTCMGSSSANGFCDRSVRHSKTMMSSSRLFGTEPYELHQTLPLNVTEYIFQALRPRKLCSENFRSRCPRTDHIVTMVDDNQPRKHRYRIVFSAHSHEFQIHTHTDGTLEVTVPAMTWNVRDDPGFVIATFKANKRVVTVSYCSLARESHLLIAYISAFLLLTYTLFVEHTSSR